MLKPFGMNVLQFFFYMALCHKKNTGAAIMAHAGRILLSSLWFHHTEHITGRKRLSGKSLLILAQKDLPLCPIVIQTAKAYRRQAPCLDTDKITFLLCKRRMGKQTGSSQSSSSSNSKWWNIVIFSAPLRAEGRWRRRSWRWRRRRRKHLNKWQVLGEISLLNPEPSACFIFFFSVHVIVWNIDGEWGGGGSYNPILSWSHFMVIN